MVSPTAAALAAFFRLSFIYKGYPYLRNVDFVNELCKLRIEALNDTFMRITSPAKRASQFFPHATEGKSEARPGREERIGLLPGR